MKVISLRSARTTQLASLLTGSVACDPWPSEGAICTESSGAVAISELMVDPSGIDRGSEWIELHNRDPDLPVDLVAWTLTYARPDGMGRRQHTFGELTLAPASYAVLSNASHDPALLGEAVDYGYGADLGDMSNQDGRIELHCGDGLVDAVVYRTPTPSTARAFDGQLPPDAALNDTLAHWCDAKTRTLDGSFGTPGLVNDPCATLTPPSDGRSCLEPDGSTRLVRTPVPGDLTLNEVMADPSRVEDSVGEWLELAVLRATDLNGLALSRSSVALAHIESESCLAALPGDLVVLARDAQPGRNGGLPANAIALSFSLPNSPGSIDLVSGTQTLDSWSWTTTPAGASLSADPADPSTRCPSTTPYGAGDLGTPGGTNTPCEATTSAMDSGNGAPSATEETGESPEAGTSSETTGTTGADAETGSDVDPSRCLDGRTSRSVRAPTVGDLVISELMPNPSVAPDDRGEWVELHATTAVDLNGLQFGRGDDLSAPLLSGDCLALEAGESALFVRDQDPSQNGGLPGGYPLPIVLVQEGGTLTIAYGGTELDAVAWESSAAGVAQSLSADALDPVSNDAAASWCAAVDTLPSGELGTPGAPNPSCLGDGVCTDSAGNLRSIRAPQPEDLRISEWMASPTAVSDSVGEWIELHALADLDLNGVALGRTLESVVPLRPTEGTCLAIAANERMLLARSDDPAENGGLEDVVATFSFSLVGTGGSIFLTHGDEVLDSVAWEDASDGASAFVSETGTLCTAEQVYGAHGERGTPGTQNELCL